MAITTYQGWVNDGKPIKPAVCIADWIATLRRHGYEVGYYPDDRHLKAQPPEDHTPYSHTPWPGIQPYPYVLASDLMPPTKPGLPSLAAIGARVVADKRAGVPGTEWIKYINWTDSKGNCWHDEWEPGYRRSTSSDRGHIHVSARTDYVSKHTSYDPVGVDMYEVSDRNVDWATTNRALAAVTGKDAVYTVDGKLRTEVNEPMKLLRAIAAAIANLEPGSGGGGLTETQVRAIIREELDQTKLGPQP